MYNLYGKNHESVLIKLIAIKKVIQKYNLYTKKYNLFIIEQQ